MVDTDFSAVFIDFENFYYALTNQYDLSPVDATEASVSIIGNTLDKLRSELGEFIIQQAFSDWSEYGEPKKELQKMGVRVFDVLSTPHKNSADIELSLSVQDVVLTRPDVRNIVIFAGDRDYMPIVLRSRERGKKLHFAGFEKSLSGDLKNLIGEGNFTYVNTDLLSSYKPKSTGDKKSRNDVSGIRELTTDELAAAIAAVNAFDDYKQKYGSVKLSGFLVDKLATALPSLNHTHRREIFQVLVEKQILQIKSISSTYDESEVFSVFVVDEDNSIVKKVRKRMVEGEQLVKKAAKESVDEEGTVTFSSLRDKIQEIDPDFSLSKFGSRAFSEFLGRYSAILARTGLNDLGDKIYKVQNMQ